MKRALSIILAILVIAASFGACAKKPTAELTQENVKATIDTSFSALKKVDKQTLEKYVESSTLDLILGYTEKHEQFKTLGIEMFKSLSYEIISIDLEGKTATLSVINKDLTEATTRYTNSLLSNYTTVQLIQRLSNDTWLNNNLTKLIAQLEDAEMKAEPAEITIEIKEGKENLVLVFDEDDENEISGGVLGAISSITR